MVSVQILESALVGLIGLVGLSKTCKQPNRVSVMSGQVYLLEGNQGNSEPDVWKLIGGAKQGSNR